MTGVTWQSSLDPAVTITPLPLSAKAMLHIANTVKYPEKCHKKYYLFYYRYKYLYIKLINYLNKYNYYKNN